MGEAKVINRIIMDYSLFSSQKVNRAKSKIFFLNVSPLVQSRLTHFWGFFVGQFPCKYLGILFSTGSEKHNFWEQISRAISSRILSWSHKWLSFSGKIVLIKAILNVVPIYLLSVLKAPKKTMIALHSVLRSFIWNENVNKKGRIPLLAWDRICAPRDKGGGGVKDIGKQNLALGDKLVWKLYKQPSSKWASILFAKYLNNGSREAIFTASSLPKGSIIWNFMVECRSVIFPGLSWLVHNGRKARFWEEIWNGFPTLFSLRDWSPLMSSLKSSWGIFVADYICVDSSGLLPVAKWKSIDSLPVDQDIKSTFVEELNKRVKGYDLPYKLFWHAACLPKAGAFAWIFRKNSSTLQDVLFCIEKLISETVLAFIYKGISLHNTFTPWDNWITKHWPALQSLPLIGAISKTRSSLNRKEVVWLPPSASKYKLNFAGASRGNPGKSAIGIVVSDNRDCIIKAQCQCISNGTNNVVELHALSTRLDLLLSLHLLDVVIEGDSQGSQQGGGLPGQ
ncbi:uncharacterized protein LOC131859353 [Cryptomeria japonica]|uniref:uncharacterized protein LOC131859353 n=1 Tax=Cryptomeria japonica TaxID=3369 RepID=UPI0027DA9445|nr:uncharacterized protein LOC131859353 [Cryptomeria japonica]